MQKKILENTEVILGNNTDIILTVPNPDVMPPNLDILLPNLPNIYNLNINHVIVENEELKNTLGIGCGNNYKFVNIGNNDCKKITLLGKDIFLDKINESLYNVIERLEKRVKELEDKVTNLEYAPGGIIAIEAEKHFENCIQEMKK